MRDEADRDAVCDAYELLLSRALGRYAADAELRAIARESGVRGGVVGGGWDGAAVAAALERCADIALERPLRLDCGCEPLRCHAQSLAQRIQRALVSEWDWSPTPGSPDGSEGEGDPWDL